jgi:hypothetical protein
MKRAFLFVILVTLLVSGDNSARAQEPMQRSPAIVKGVVSRESHDSYVIRAHKGQVMTVQISWPLEHDPGPEAGQRLQSR